MPEVPYDRRAAALAAIDACNFAEAYRFWLPLAEAGDAEAQGAVGSLVSYGFHRFDSLEQLESGPPADAATATADQEAGEAWLTAASAAGFGPASFNLAGLVVAGSGPWEQRKARAAELYALAQTQGFTPFGWLMNGTGPGQPYLDAIESHMTGGELSQPPEWWRGEPSETLEGGPGD